jgi:hypothetical protein
MAGVKDSEWFCVNHRLNTSGVPVSSLQKHEVLELEVVKFFGKKASKSGWNYREMVTPEQADAILDLHRYVYNDEDAITSNNEITL